MSTKPLVETKLKIRRSITSKARRRLSAEFIKRDSSVRVFVSERYRHGSQTFDYIHLTKDEACKLAEFLRATGGEG